MTNATKAAGAMPKIGSVWRHKKGGGTYVVRAHCLIEATLEPGVLYQGRNGFVLDGVVWNDWLRPAAEFMDGRFEQIYESAIPAETPDQGEALRTARAELIEANAELIYLRLYGKDGALWSANDSKEVWRAKARVVPVSPALAAIDRALAILDAATPAPDERRSVAEIRAEIERLRVELSRPGLWDRTLVEEHIAALEWTLAPPKPPAEENAFSMAARTMANRGPDHIADALRAKAGLAPPKPPAVKET